MKLLIFVVLVISTSNAKKALNKDIIKSDGDFEFVVVNEVRIKVLKTKSTIFLSNQFTSKIIRELII